MRGSLTFTKAGHRDRRARPEEWLIDWDRSLKTKTNYHGLIHGVFAYAVKRGYLTANPAIGSQRRPVSVTVGTGLWFRIAREVKTVRRCAQR